MFVGIGVGVGRQRFAGNFADSYSVRVLADGGTIESLTCVANASALLQQASLLFIPSGYKAGVAYSALPNNGNGDLTWTRNSTAYRTNSSGQLEEIAYNLLLRTEEFENSAWIKIASSVVSNTTIAPNGTLTADSYTANGTLTIHRVYSSFSSIANLSYTVSVYAKKETNDFFQIWIQAGGAFPSNICFANYNLANGTLGTVGSGATANIESVGNGWYRCSFTCLATSTASSNLNFTIITSDTAPIAESNSLSTSIYLWGAQVVLGSNVKTYLPISSTRNNFPRLSYMYGSCPSALLEPQRTNLILQSEDLTSSSWVSEGVTLSSNSTNAPDGANTADLIQEQAINDVHRVYPNIAIAITSGANYACSFFVKKDTRQYVRLVFSQSSSTTVWVAAQFDLDNQTFTSGVGSGGGTFVSASITSASNGFYRITLVSSLPATLCRLFLALSNGTAISSSDSRGCNTYSGSTSNRLWAWGGQLELGAYATTYIPTTTATATRLADTFTRNNIYTNGLISSSGGTWYVELKNNVAYVRDAFGALYFGTQLMTTGTNGDGFFFRRNDANSNRLAIQKYINGIASALYSTLTDTIKVAIKWNGTTADVFVNGVKVVTASSFTATQLEFLGHTTTGDVPKFIQTMALFNEPKSDQFCIDLTT